MSDSFDVIVVGLGAMGSATCYHLASRGVRVLGLERFDIPHAMGSSHGFSRLIRLAYYEHADYVPLLKSAYNLWHRLETASGQKIIYITGGLYAGPPGSEVIAGSIGAAQKHDLSYDALDAGQIRGRFPKFTVPDDYVGMFEHNAGFVLPERAIAAHCELALRAGAELHGRETVTAWDADDSGVRVRTDRGMYRAGHVVFCGGAWSNQLLGEIGVPLTVTRQVLAWVWPKESADFELGRFPAFAIAERDGHGLFYGFPMMRDNPGLKIAMHLPATPTDPDRLIREPLAGDEETFRPALARHLPSADGPLLSLRVCMYTNTPDGHFILDRHPSEPRVSIACGFSGHGFKFSSVIGQAMADLAINGGTELPIEFLGLKRFAVRNG